MPCLNSRPSHRQVGLQVDGAEALLAARDFYRGAQGQAHLVDLRQFGYMAEIHDADIKLWVTHVQ